MKIKTINEVSEVYDLELDKVVRTIGENNAKKVLLQFPEGMKPYAQTIVDEIERRIDCQCFIWMGSCFGACDLPLEVSELGVDLIVQFGHSDWKFDKNKKISII